MDISLNLSANDALDILRLMHNEYVRLLTVNYTTLDDDEQADAANGAIRIGELRKAYELMLLDRLGQAEIDRARLDFERTCPTPTRPQG